MKNFMLRPFGYLGALIACAFMALTTGCASGGYKITRQYAQFVNKQNLILRIIIYIFTGVVFAITLLIDMVIFNTMDFWEGRVSAGDYNFKQGEKSYFVKHEVLEKSRKRSTIQVRGADQSLLQTVVLQETAAQEIEVYVDGQLRTKVRDITGLPIASVYDAKGNLTLESVITEKAGTTASY